MLQLRPEKRPSADGALAKLKFALPTLDPKRWDLEAVQGNRAESSPLASKRLYGKISENGPDHNPR